MGTARSAHGPHPNDGAPMSGPGESWPGESWLDDDERLLADLGDAVRSGRAVPERFVEIGRAAFVWHDVDVDLATLLYDSALTGLPAGVRSSDAGIRALSFEADGLAIEVELSAGGIVGQVVPAQPGTVEVWVGGAALRSVELDDNGWFDLGPPPGEPFRLCVRMAAVVLTDPINPAPDATPPG